MSSARFQKPQVCSAIARRKVNHQEFLVPTLSASKEWNAKSAIKPQWPVLHQIAKIDIKYETEIHHWCFGPAECENTPMIVSENIKDVFENYWKLHNRSINVSKMLMRKLTWYPKDSYTLPQLKKIDSSLTKITSSDGLTPPPLARLPTHTRYTWNLKNGCNNSHCKLFLAILERYTFLKLWLQSILTKSCIFKICISDCQISCIRSSNLALLSL